MPTGYTAAVADGTITELKPFILQLARGMGALVMMRDDPADAPIPERFEPSQSNAKRAAGLERELAAVQAMSDSEARDAAIAAYAEWKAERDKGEARHKAERERYLAMIAKVEAWKSAPEGIKQFALEQLRSGLEFDCREPFKWYSEPPSLSGERWKRSQIERLTRSIANHLEYQREEEERVARRNEWLAQLRASLEECK